MAAGDNGSGRTTTATGGRSGPIFLVGCGRSGTTVIYEALCEHRDLAWISNYTERAPRLPQLAALATVRHLQHPPKGAVRGVQWRPHPVEGYRLWDWCAGELPGGVNRPLDAADVTDVARRRTVKAVAAHLRYQRAARFLNKNTRNARRIPYLLEIFPDAHFVHIVRDPRAVALSLARVAFWPDLPIWWANDRTPSELERSGRSMVSIAAEFWVREVTQVRADAQALAPDRFVEVAYEDFVNEPVDGVARLLEGLGLPTSEEVDRAVRARVRSDPRPGRVSPSRDDQNTIWSIVEEVARGLGYLPLPAR
jgi:hypothetical protein